MVAVASRRLLGESGVAGRDVAMFKRQVVRREGVLLCRPWGYTLWQPKVRLRAGRWIHVGDGQ